MAIGVPSVAALTLGGITQDEYDKKARELKGRQNEIAPRIDQHPDSEGDYRTTLESLISVASRAADIFERSKTEQKRELIAFVVSNLRLRGKKLEYSMLIRMLDKSVSMCYRLKHGYNLPHKPTEIPTRLP